MRPSIAFAPSRGFPKPRLAVSPQDVPEAFALGIRPSCSVIVVTRGLLARLEPKEVEAVLAHELSHIVNRDGAVMTAASFPLFAGSWLIRKGREKPVTLLVLVLVFPYLLAAAALCLVSQALTRASRSAASSRPTAARQSSPARRSTSRVRCRSSPGPLGSSRRRTFGMSHP
jgi:heat shock protein HtpX